MRDAFIRELMMRAEDDASVMLVVGDLGYGVVEDFAKAFPRQFVNSGIAEQSMLGMAGGLAAAGHRVFVYSIGNFPTIRALEQIRNDLCYHNRDVTIVSVGAGVAYGTLGYSHHAVEDIGSMRALPNLRLYCPADPVEVAAVVRFAARSFGTKYIRLGKNGEETLHRTDNQLNIHEALFLRYGRDALIAATGAIVGNCMQAADQLSSIGIQTTVLSIPSVVPLPSQWIANLDATTPVVTVEEHRLAAGFGSAVLELVNSLGKRLRVSRMGLDDSFLYTLGSQEFLRAQSGLSPSDIANVVVQMVTTE